MSSQFSKRRSKQRRQSEQLDLGDTFNPNEQQKLDAKTIRATDRRITRNRPFPYRGDTGALSLQGTDQNVLRQSSYDNDYEEKYDTSPLPDRVERNRRFTYAYRREDNLGDAAANDPSVGRRQQRANSLSGRLDPSADDLRRRQQLQEEKMDILNEANERKETEVLSEEALSEALDKLNSEFPDINRETIGRLISRYNLNPGDLSHLLSSSEDLRRDPAKVDRLLSWENDARLLARYAEPNPQNFKKEDIRSFGVNDKGELQSIYFDKGEIQLMTKESLSGDQNNDVPAPKRRIQVSSADLDRMSEFDLNLLQNYVREAQSEIRDREEQVDAYYSEEAERLQNEIHALKEEVKENTLWSRRAFRNTAPALHIPPQHPDVARLNNQKIRFPSGQEVDRLQQVVDQSPDIEDIREFQRIEEQIKRLEHQNINHNEIFQRNYDNSRASLQNTRFRLKTGLPAEEANANYNTWKLIGDKNKKLKDLFNTNGIELQLNDQKVNVAKGPYTAGIPYPPTKERVDNTIYDGTFIPNDLKPQKTKEEVGFQDFNFSLHKSLHEQLVAIRKRWKKKQYIREIRYEAQSITDETERQRHIAGRIAEAEANDFAEFKKNDPEEKNELEDLMKSLLKDFFNRSGNDNNAINSDKSTTRSKLSKRKIQKKQNNQSRLGRYIRNLGKRPLLSNFSSAQKESFINILDHVSQNPWVVDTVKRLLFEQDEQPIDAYAGGESDPTLDNDDAGGGSDSALDDDDDLYE